MAKLTTHRRRVHASAPAKKPGYCENCHAKYEDLYAHVKTTAHQTFARNPVNYTELDVLLSNVARPHRPQPPPAAEAKGDLLPDVPGNHRARTIADAAVALGMPPLLVQLRLSCRRS
ncbi:Cdc7p-Dbf4p kinase complex regulatory subunit [Tieghemiomyces parasiticus]|uniref:Cdc7p-Dbf4p kinase complex regulatory subunit n=1 Tax=Tieghemiomyces parasiticus TaxID=78921 RepID=A0A9W8DHH6_9FUNG|nr:Cdc7p-Dbf4p kinase complex regulatory subunit [Tieghemiomyces parasiticus]